MSPVSLRKVVLFFSSVAKTQQAGQDSRRQGKKDWFWCEASRTARGLRSWRSNHYFTYFPLHTYLFESCPSSMHHLLVKHRAMHHAIIERLYPLCSEARGLIPLAGRQTVICTGMSEKKNRIGNSITSIPQLRIIMMADLCGPSSQGASRELSRSAGDSHTAWMQSQ